MLPPIFARYGKYDIASQAPFRRIPYTDALETYGTDKPDLRIDLTAIDVSSLASQTEFAPFSEGNTVKAVVISDCALTRKQIDKLCADVEVQSGAKPYWLRVDETGALTGGVAKFLEPQKESLTKQLKLKPGSLVAFGAGKGGQAQKCGCS